MPLPSSLDYRERYEPLPKDASRHTVSLSARNGNSFSDGGEEIIFDFHQTGYLVPDSLYLRFKLTAEAPSSGTFILLPFYNVFSKLETIIDDNTVDSINNYGRIQTLLVNLTMNVAQKYSNAFNLGITSSTNIENQESLTISSNTTTIVSLSGYIPCLLSNCDKLIPLQFMPKISMIFTTDILSNIISNFVTSVVGITISNPELCYDCVKLGEEYDKKIMSLGKIFIESQSFTNSSVFTRLSSNGNRNINFSSNLSYVKCAFITFSSMNTVNGGKLNDAVDITNESGSYSMSIGNIQYPQVEMSALLNRSGVLMELKKCMKIVFGNGSNFSINDLEFGANDNFVAATNPLSYGKFILPFLFEYINMRGEKQCKSVKNETITVNIKQSVVQSVNRPCNLILVYKGIFEIDLKNRLVKVLN